MSDLVGNPEDWFSHNEAQNVPNVHLKALVCLSVKSLIFFNCRGDGAEPVRKLKSLECVKTEIYWYSLRLRHQRRFDDANRLEKLFDTLTEHIGMYRPMGYRAGVRGSQTSEDI